MRNEPWHVYEDCSTCFSEQNERAITFPRGPKTCDIMFVGQAPSFDQKLSKTRPVLDCSQGSKAARLFCDVLKELDYDPESFYFTNLIKCSDLSLRKEGSRANCYQFFSQELKDVNPKRIVALGRKVESFLKKQEIQVPICFAYHPAYLLRNAISREDYSQQLRNAIKGSC